MPIAANTSRCAALRRLPVSSARSSGVRSMEPPACDLRRRERPCIEHVARGGRLRCGLFRSGSLRVEKPLDVTGQRSA